MSNGQRRQRPRLRTAEKVHSLYPLGKFPPGFALSVGRQIIYHLSTTSRPTLEGKTWEEMFAKAVGAKWVPSNVGLDDIQMDKYSIAWGAKTIKNRHPYTCETVRLISGRCSPVYSYGDTVSIDADPDDVGSKVLDIWNSRVESVRSRFRTLRTVVLIKGAGLLELAVFEIDTVRYDPEQYLWEWNANGNLEGYDSGEHKFTWQPHGSQFTIKEKVPENRLCLKLRKPGKIDPDKLLGLVGFEDSWVEIVPNP
jgi:hypothetical protein